MSDEYDDRISRCLWDYFFQQPLERFKLLDDDTFSELDCEEMEGEIEQ